MSAATARRIALVGHVVPIPSLVRPTPAEAWAANFSRVFVNDGEMIDHVAYLKAKLGHAGRFSVWEMQLCAPPLLTSRLERAGAEVLIVNSIDADNEADALARIRSFGPDLLVLSTTFILSPAQLNAVAKTLRTELPDVFVVAGGHHVAATLRDMTEATRMAYLKATGLNAFVDDYQGDATLEAVVRAFPGGLESVPNLVLRRSDGTYVVTPRERESNPVREDRPSLDGLPRGAAIHLRTSRGCAFSCGFCSYPTTAGPVDYLDLEDARAELRAAKQAGVGALLFADDTFNVPKARFRALVEIMIEEKLGIPWYSFLRCQFVDEPLVERMRLSGCEAVFLGVESGSDRLLREMGKHSRVEHYRRGIGWLKKAGIKTVGSFLIGYPGENAESVRETREFIETAGLDYYFMQLFYYVAHTPVHAKAREYGLRGKGLLFSHSTMDWKEAHHSMAEIFRSVHGPIAVHQDYNLWELAFLRWKGMSWDSIDAYRREIHRLTTEQMDAGKTAWAG